MGVGFYNNWDFILDKIENLFRSEFAGTLSVYRGMKNTSAGNHY